MIKYDAYMFIGLAQSTFNCPTMLQEISEVIIAGVTYPQENNL